MFTRILTCVLVASLWNPPKAEAFTHPGIPCTAADLAAIKLKVQEGQNPWKIGYDKLAADWHSSLGYTMQGPFATVTRNPHLHRNEWMNDMQAVWNLARMWYFTGDTAYAQKSHDILLAWASGTGTVDPVTGKGAAQTTFGGMESNLDLGDHAFRFAGGADILRGTWPGWTQADTDAVKALFGNVYWNAGEVLGPGNKGGLNLSAATAIAIFNDDQAKLDHALELLRAFPSTGFVNTLSNGEHGETGRDQGHSYGQMLAMAFTAEVLWKQGIDVFSERDNRILAMGEYFARFNLGVTTPFVPMGTTDEYYLSILDAPGYPAEPMAFNIMKSAYVLRKGLSAPYLERKLAAQAQNMDAFMFLKSSDSSTAAPPPAITFPTASPVGTGLTNLDIGGATPAGSGTFSDGTWTVNGAGTDIWTHGAESFHFLYKQVTGDCTMIAKVNTVQNTHINAKAGVMIRSDLNADPAARAWVGITPAVKVESHFDGWSNMYGGSNWEKQSYPVPQIPYWVKIERRGNLITTYASPDGTSWATIVVGTYDTMPATAYIGLAVSSLVNGTLNTSTFTNVSVTGGTDGAVVVPAAPLAVHGSPGDGHVPLRWLESAGATTYQIKRATVSGGPYATLATVSGTSYVDTPVVNDTPYYYVVTASNSAGESPTAPEEAVIPRKTLESIVGSTGSATASANSSSSTEGAAVAFDFNSGSKWFNGHAGTTGWLRYGFPAGVTETVTCYDIVSGSDVPGRDPKDWEFQGSQNGSTWTVLDTQSGQSFLGRLFPKRYYIANTTAYRYYRLNVTANNGDATGLQLSELSLLKPTADQLPPLAPTGFSISAVSATETFLTWNAPAGAIAYNVKRSSSSGGPYAIVATGLGSLSFSDSGLTPGNTYYYVVSAANGTGESPDSAQIAITLEAQFKYWDTNGTTAGTGTAGGTWDGGTTANWSTNSAGTAAAEVWSNGDSAIFSAGTNATGQFNITNAGVTVGNITQEEGRGRVMGGTLTLASPVMTIATLARVSGDYDLRIDSAVVNSAGGASTLTKTGPGIALFTGNLSGVTGGITLNAGTLALEGGVNTGTAPLTLNAGTLARNFNSVTLNNPINVTGAVNVIGYQNGGDFILTGPWLAGATGGNFNVLNSSVNGFNPFAMSIRISGDISAYTGTFTHTPGNNRLRFGPLTNPGTAILIDAANARFATAGSTTAGNPIDITDNTHGTFRMGELSGTGGIIRAGWNSANTTTFEIGALNTNTSFAGVITDNGTGKAAVTKVGTGMWTIVGNLAYTGPTQVNAGILNIAGSLTGNGGVTVANGGTLTGTGSVAGTTVVAEGGIVAPGDGGAGTLQLASFSPAGGSVMEVELGTSSDLLTLTGTYTPPSIGKVVLNVTDLTGFGAHTYSLITGATGISAADFSLGSMPIGHAYQLEASAGTLSLVVTAAPVLPSVPADVTAAGGDSQVAIAWTAVANASHYTVMRSTVSGTGYSVVGSNVTATDFTQNGLTNGTTFYYVVTAENAAGSSALSAEASATPLSAVQSWRVTNFGTIDNTGNAADDADPDGDGWTNSQEFISGTDPNDRTSLLKISQMTPDGNDMTIEFLTVLGKTYRLERSDTLQNGSWLPVQDNIAGTGGIVQITDPGGAAQSKRFYRVTTHHPF